MLSSWTVNIGTTFFLEAFAMKYGKIMPHCMAKELPVCSKVTSVVDFLRKATNFIFSAFMIKHTLQVEPILKVNFFAVSVGEQVYW